MQANPLWLLFMTTTVVFAYLSMNVNVENEKTVKNPAKSFRISLIVLAGIVLVAAYFVSITPNFGWKDGALIGAILFICGFIPSFYVYRLRARIMDEFEDE